MRPASRASRLATRGRSPRSRYGKPHPLGGRERYRCTVRAKLAPTDAGVMAEKMERTPPAELPLVGREGELASVRGVVSGSTPHGAIVIAGEPGIGKTTLWEAGVPTGASNRARVSFSARPSGAEARLAYSALIDLLDGVDHRRAGRAAIAAAACARGRPPPRRPGRRATGSERDVGRVPERAAGARVAAPTGCRDRRSPVARSAVGGGSRLRCAQARGRGDLVRPRQATGQAHTTRAGARADAGSSSSTWGRSASEPRVGCSPRGSV